MNIAFLHHRDTRNLGDRWCSPFDWFDWPDHAAARDLQAPGPSYDIGIYGGGKILGGLAASPAVTKVPGSLHIAWGVGTLQTFPVSLRYIRARALCDLIGSRDHGDDGYTWAPCVSCMAPQFDSPPAARFDAVFYYHAGKTRSQKIVIPDGMPKLPNNCDSIEEALDFIASGKTVISNSYHGVYWALLMGRKVICIPFSRKFAAYREAPHYSTPRSWLGDLSKGIARPGMLDECRAATLAFKERVDDLIDRHGRVEANRDQG